jgi:hypothetical protein
MGVLERYNAALIRIAVVRPNAINLSLIPEFQEFEEFAVL